MLGWLFGRTPVRVWAIKQIDDATLHLCGEGRLESGQKRKQMLDALRAGRFHGGVRMGAGIVINTRQLASVVPSEDLTLSDNGDTAQWQGRRWVVSYVPQRSWLFDGPLVAEPNPLGGPPALVSREDVSHIRRNVRQDAAPPGEVVFRPVNELEDPEKDLRTSIEQAQHWRKNARRGWRKDGTWGPLDEVERE
ncbi:hypothetical protein ACFFU2_10605 [Halomonas alkalicola]|uniref:Uncharacterized protein n=1 Tax=Halomonas alkalicola TaxID=1930622 RepID=A0ABY9H1X3_9GAMM|nr:hypothetical protein [Halomonas alkalicola]WLI72482.1 hypothetical protein B6N23_11940 [Halomonas alkalicola]